FGNAVVRLIWKPPHDSCGASMHVNSTNRAKKWAFSNLDSILPSNPIRLLRAKVIMDRLSVSSNHSSPFPTHSLAVAFKDSNESPEGDVTLNRPSRAAPRNMNETNGCRPAVV